MRYGVGYRLGLVRGWTGYGRWGWIRDWLGRGGRTW